MTQLIFPSTSDDRLAGTLLAFPIAIPLVKGPVRVFLAHSQHSHHNLNHGRPQLLGPSLGNLTQIGHIVGFFQIGHQSTIRGILLVTVKPINICRPGSDRRGCHKTHGPVSFSVGQPRRLVRRNAPVPAPLLSIEALVSSSTFRIQSKIPAASTLNSVWASSSLRSCCRPFLL